MAVTLTSAEGDEIALTPGRTWVLLPQPGHVGPMTPTGRATSSTLDLTRSPCLSSSCLVAEVHVSHGSAPRASISRLGQRRAADVRVSRMGSRGVPP